MQRLKSSVGLVLLCVMHMWTGSTNGCFFKDAELQLYLDQKLITAEAGCARIPCSFLDVPKAINAKQIWFKGSPEFPLAPPEIERTNGLKKTYSTQEECSVILWDLIGQDRTEEYGFMLELRTHEKHIFPERVNVFYSAAKVNITLSTEILVATKMAILTCSISDLCPGSDTKVTWKGLGSKQLLPLRWKNKELHFIPVPEDHQAEITCEVTFGKNLTASATVTLTVHSQPQILNSSACTLRQGLLTCVCVSQGVPLPDIHWDLLQDNKSFNPFKASDHHVTVNSTFTMTAEDFGRIGDVICVSRNYLGQAHMTLPVITEGNPDQIMEDNPNTE
ncbi:sialic acid-binding Ig-like lectin 12 [Misgurnus anguillicaudatus]|uniref:sialic acid-binding Ig-like lectin 12 n=1 Tax=Misgurnus anguillicaudatus TaxID=75329 RepID=UPI003CCFA81F